MQREREIRAAGQAAQQLCGGFGLGESAKSVRRVFPIAVTFDRYPMEFLSYEALQNRFRDAGVFADPRVQPVEVIHISEWERLLSRAHEFELSAVIARTHAEPDRSTRGTSLQNYLYATGDPQVSYQRVIIPRRRDCIVFATERLFGSEAAERMKRRDPT